MKFLTNAALVFIFVLFFSGCAGTMPISDADRTFDRVVEIKGNSKDKIYESTKMWIAENFRSAKAVLEYEDKDSGVIIGNSSMKYPCSGLECLAKSDWTVSFTMRVDIKDDKFRLAFTNLETSWPPSYDSLGAHPGHRGKMSTQGQLDDVKPVLLAMGDEIATYISKENKNGNW